MVLLGQDSWGGQDSWEGQDSWGKGQDSWGKGQDSWGGKGDGKGAWFPSQQDFEYAKLVMSMVTSKGAPKGGDKGKDSWSGKDSRSGKDSWGGKGQKAQHHAAVASQSWAAPSKGKQSVGFDPTRIFVGGLPQTVQSSQLGGYFSQFGTVTEAKVHMDSDSGRSKGFGYVSFDSESAVEEAIASAGQGLQIDEKRVEVKRCEARTGGGKGGSLGKGKDSGKCKESSSGKGKRKSGKQKSENPRRQKDNFQWKGQLNHAYARECKTDEGKTNLSKDSFTYTTLPLEDGTFMSTVTCDRFPSEYSTEEPYTTAKEAEEAVALAALMAEFPACYEAIPEERKQHGSMAAFIPVDATNIVQQQFTPIEDEEPENPAKRKAPHPHSGVGPKGNYLQPRGTKPTDPKSRLNDGLTILKGTPLTRADTSYTAVESNGSIVATLTVHCFEGQSHSFTGLAAGDRKEAEQYAAEATLKAFQAQIDEKMPEHEARKAANERARQMKKKVARLGK